MNVICCGVFVANSILKKSFDDNIYITPLKLNCLIYLLYSNYLFKTGDILFNEMFIKTEKGPILISVDWKFGCFQDTFITNLGKDSLGKIFIMKGNSFLECLSYIWNNYKYMSDIEIFNFVNNDCAIKNRELHDILMINDILDDEIRRNEEILERVKRRRFYDKGK